MALEEVRWAGGGAPTLPRSAAIAVKQQLLTRKEVQMNGQVNPKPDLLFGVALDWATTMFADRATLTAP